jgi:hypothetical protein
MTEALIYLVLWLLFGICLLIWIFAVIGSMLGALIPGSRTNWDNAKLGLLAVVAYLVARWLTDSADPEDRDHDSSRQDRDRGGGPDQGNECSIEQLSDEAVLDEVFGQDRRFR